MKLSYQYKVARVLGALALPMIVQCSHKGSEVRLRSENKIRNGTEVAAGDVILDSTVGIYADLDGAKGKICTGTLITKNLVLTAAHCVPNRLVSLSIVFERTFEKGLASGATNPDVDLVAEDPAWDPTAPENYQAPSGEVEGDLAILRFKGRAPDGYLPATLADPSLQLKKTDYIYMAGYGATDGVTLKNAGVLRKTEVSALQQDQDNPDLWRSDQSNTGGCLGDSGGPGYVKVNDKLLLWGVFHGIALDEVHERCAYLGYHTEIVTSLDWIHLAESRLTFMASPPRLTLVRITNPPLNSH